MKHIPHAFLKGSVLRSLIFAAAASSLLLATPAQAMDEALEFWLNPSISTDLDDDTSVELETAQRFRSAADGREDTYFVRLWLNQSLSDSVTLGGALERRVNDGASNEVRTMQQLSTKHGIVRTRLRLEQRFVDNANQTGLRLRPRIGISVPLDDDKKWSSSANVEGFWTLASTRSGGTTGITGMRTQVGVKYKASDTVSVGLTYLRQQDFRDNAPDEVGHAPLIGLELSF